MAALAALVGLLGLVIGSCLNVVAYRVPRSESIVRPRSRCPSCAAEISAADNIPVLSWLALRGRCRHCDAPISIRYPAVEIVTAALFALATFRFGASAVLPAYLVLFAALVAVTATDLDLRVVPKRIVWPAFALAAVLLTVAALFEGEPVRLRDAGLGSAGAFAVLFVIHLVSPGGMGFGDVRLAALLGLFLGWLGPAHVPLGLFLGFVAGGVAGVVALARGRSRKASLPFVPFLAVGTAAAVFFGAPILDWYLGAG